MLETSSENLIDYRDILKQELVFRQDKNSQYSLRAFARDLEVDPGQLSKVIQGKKNISLINAANLARKITDHPIKAQLFFMAVEYSQAKSAEAKAELKTKMQKLSQETMEREENVADNEFETISSWYHLPMIQLAFTKSFATTQQTAAKYFGISVDEAKMALERLTRLGFMEKKDGYYRRFKSLVTTTDIPSLAIRQFHMQMLDKAKKALFYQPIHKRYFSSVTLRIPQAHLEDYKKIINEAEDKILELSKRYENNDSNEVYHFSSQLFSLKKEDYND